MPSLGRSQVVDLTVGSLSLRGEWQEVQPDGTLATLRELDRVRAKGKSEAVGLFELVDAHPSPLAAAKRRHQPAFTRALENWRAGELDAAATAFQHYRDRVPEDRVPALYLARIQSLRSRPPDPDWDGVWSLQQK